MFSTALIVFREVLEAAMVISIVMAATKAVPRRGVWIASGLAGGLLGACLVAVFAGAIQSWASGMGQEIFNASVMFIAVAMLTWHSVWMGRHGRELSQNLMSTGRQVQAGSKSLLALALVVGLALLREGSETVLFLYGIAVSDSGSLIDMSAGAMMGIAGGVAMGAALYLGLLQISMKRIFSVTNALIILLAAGMASQGVGFLVDANMVPAWGFHVWDSSWLLSDSSVFGQVLHALVGYTARPAGIQVAVYLITLIGIVLAVRYIGHPAARQAPTRHGTAPEVS